MIHSFAARMPRNGRSRLSGVSIAANPPCTKLNPVENVWAYLRQNKLANRLYRDYEHIVDACRELHSYPATHHIHCYSKMGEKIREF